MHFSESSVVLSVLVCELDSPSHRTHRTANESNGDDLAQEVLRQIRQHAYPTLPAPTHSIISPSNYYLPQEKRWICVDSAFVRPPQSTFLSPSLAPNVFNVGIQNGKSNYHFTSFESAVQNALHFLDNPAQRNIRIGDILFLLFVLFVVLLWFRCSLSITRTGHKKSLGNKKKATNRWT